MQPNLEVKPALAVGGFWVNVGNDGKVADACGVVHGAGNRGICLPTGAARRRLWRGIAIGMFARIAEQFGTATGLAVVTMNVPNAKHAILLPFPAWT